MFWKKKQKQSIVELKQYNIELSILKLNDGSVIDCNNIMIELIRGEDKTSYNDIRDILIQTGYLFCWKDIEKNKSIFEQAIQEKLNYLYNKSQYNVYIESIQFHYQGTV